MRRPRYNRRDCLGLACARRRHGHERCRHDPSVGDARCRRHDDAARGVDPQLCRTDVCDVVGHDGGDDAAERRPHAAVVRAAEPQRKSRRSSLCPDRDLRRRLSRGMGRLQRACHWPAVGLGAGGFAVADDGDDQLLARWHTSPPRRDLATHADEERLPAALPLASEFPGAELAARASGVPCAWGSSTAAIAWGAAGS